MKALLLYMLLFAYATVIFRPVFPYVSDAVSHLLFLKQHMATVHFENGKYHVHKEVIQHTKEQQQGNAPASSKKTETGNDHIIPAGSSSTPDSYYYLPVHTASLPPGLSTGALSYDYPPPRFFYSI